MDGSALLVKHGSIAGLDIANNYHDTTETGSENNDCHVKRRKLSHVLVEGPAIARSAYQNWEPPQFPSTESSVIYELETSSNTSRDNKYIYAQLEHFSIYHTPNSFRHALEFETLDNLQNTNGVPNLLFDGFLVFGCYRRYVQGVAFRTLAVDGYGDPDIRDIQSHICIQSLLGKTSNTWYRLGQPSNEYRRFYMPFLWLAQFAKYFIDFLLDQGTGVTLRHFQHGFYRWLEHQKKTCDSSDQQPFRRWHTQCQYLKDFRTSVAAHVGYLWKECYSIDDSETGLCRHPIWKEVDPDQLDAVPERMNREINTVVTPFAYDCFERMYFGDKMEVRQITDPTVLEMINKRKARFGLLQYMNTSIAKEKLCSQLLRPQPSTLELSGSLGHASRRYQHRRVTNIRKGDFVSISPDESSQWACSTGLWYAYVLKVWHGEDSMMVDLLWLYEPCHTTLGNAYYPFRNELFVSDNCNCGSEALKTERVVGKINVAVLNENNIGDEAAWRKGTSSVPADGFFVRQKFRTIHEDDTYDFTSLQPTDFGCIHTTQAQSAFDQCLNEYRIGDTVLVRQNYQHDDVLIPALIVDFDVRRRDIVLVRLERRRFELVNPQARQQLRQGKPPINELTLSSERFTRPPTKIIRKCHVRFFDTETIQNGPPAPYNRDGAGDYYFINRDITIPPAVLPFNQGWNPLIPIEKLKGLGIFSGGGNFDRGIEDGGAVVFTHAVDWDREAVHSYRANTREQDTHLFLGSVNDYLAQAMKASGHEDIAAPGDVDCICAGSPCPGFSSMQPDKTSDSSKRNASMVASVVSFVDFYSPRYLVLENVVTMVSSNMGPNRDQNVFAQVLSALVAMGYQTQQFNMGSWSYGSPQMRARVFVVASIPGSVPLVAPPYTHDHPPKTRMRRALGKTSNGLYFGTQKIHYTPFKHNTPLKATSDLPNIGDGQVKICPAFPDHRTAGKESAFNRDVIASIPVSPDGMGIARATVARRLPNKLSDYCHSICKNAHPHRGIKSFSRVKQDYLFPTALTRMSLRCTRSGRGLHWTQHRPLSIMEYRRSQGFPDHEVIIGRPYQQLKIVGNSVDRKVALALGLALRESWTQSNRQNGATLETNCTKIDQAIGDRTTVDLITGTTTKEANPKSTIGEETWDPKFDVRESSIAHHNSTKHEEIYENERHAHTVISIDDDGDIAHDIRTQMETVDADDDLISAMRRDITHAMRIYRLSNIPMER